MPITINGDGSLVGLAAGGLPDDSVVLADLSATGTASSGTYLRGDNSWAAVSGGKIVDVKGVTKTDQFTVSSIDTFTDITGLSITHTLANSSNKLLLQYSVQVSMRTSGYTGMLRLMNDTTAICIGDADGSTVRCSNQMTGTGHQNGQWSFSNSFLYTPGDTSSHAYHLEIQTAYATALYVNRNYSWDSSWNEHGPTASTLTLMEVSA
jgi:hypothetical protein